MDNIPDSKHTSLGSDPEKVPPQKESSVKSKMKYACILIIILMVVAYLMYSLNEIQNRYDSLAKSITDGFAQVAKENQEIQGKYKSLGENINEGLAQAAKENKDVHGKYDNLAKSVSEGLAQLARENQQILGKYDNWAKIVSNGLAQAAKENKEIQGKYDNMAKKVGEGLEQAAKENKECIARALQAEYEIKSNSSYAEEALKLMEKALTDNEYELAKIYSLNAINHMPNEIKYIDAYFQLLIAQPSTIDELKRFIDILDMSVFQIAPYDVQRIIEIKSTIMHKYEAMSLAEQKKSSDEHQRRLAQRIKSLEEGELSMRKIIGYNGNVNVNMLSTRIEAINNILEEGMLDERENTKWKTRQTTSNLLFQMAVTLSSVENALFKADVTMAKTSPSKLELVTAQNQLQTANALLAQIWTMDCSSMPEQLERAKEYQGRITQVDAKIKEISSRPVYKIIKVLVNEIPLSYSQSYSSFTERIMKISQNVEKIKEKLTEVSDEKMQIEILEDLKNAESYLQELSKGRYNAYQKWALQLLRDCHVKYTSYSVVTNDRGNRLFNDYLLDINPALLSYDMQSLYNSIYQKVYNEVEDKAVSQIVKASHKCKSLEDF